MVPLFSASRLGCFVCSLNAVPVLKLFLVVFVTCLAVDLKFGCVWLDSESEVSWLATGSL